MRQGGVLSPTLFAIYINVLIEKLSESRLGCKLKNGYFGCLVYADDVMLLAHTMSGLKKILKICEEFAENFDIAFNAEKSCLIRIGKRYDFTCAQVMLNNKYILLSMELQYLGVVICCNSKFKGEQYQPSI